MSRTTGRFVLPFLTVLPALALTVLLRRFLGATPLAFLYIAILLTAAIAGRGAGWLAILLAVGGAALVMRGGQLQWIGPIAAVITLLIAGAVVELTEAGRRQGALDRARDSEMARLQRLYAALTAINQAIVKGEEPDELLPKVCRALVERGGFQMAWIGWNDPATHEIRPRARWGDDQDYLGKVRVYSDHRPEGRGPTGTAFREGQPRIINDILADPSTLPWRKPAAESGFRASAVFPIRVEGITCGTLSVYANVPGYFQSPEVALLEEASHDLSYALENLIREARHRSAEAAARELERRFEIVAENLKEGLVIASPDLELLYWNAAALRLIGFDDPEEGRHLEHEFDRHFELFTREGEPLPPDRWPLARVRAGDTLEGVELRVRRRATGRERILSYSGGRVEYGTGRSLAFVTLQDITERLVAEDALREAKTELERRVEARTAELQAALVRAESADRVKTAFLATISHELRTPLNSIIGFTGILLQGLAGPLAPEQEKQLGMVRGSARHLLALINDVLDISKIEADQLDLHLEAVDLGASVVRVAAALRPLAEQKGLALTVTVPTGLPRLTTDQRRLDQILLNLVNNGIKFTERGSVAIRVEPGADGVVRIRITDTGIGVAQADLDTLFQPFRQIDTGLARAHEGTGLGLFISRRIAELLGGSISAESAVGAGSTFTLTLPLPQER